jgi:flagellin
MPQIINTNVASLNAQRNLDRSQTSLGVALQRLSSGLRINSAKDDAAGLAISERFTTQIRGINQAIRNANDGISLAQTGEGDLAQITNNLQRIRELAVQSANATNSVSDRAALQLEASQLIAEIDRVASTSAFNGVKLLDGNFASQQFQVGANAGEVVNISNISSARTDDIGQATTYTYTQQAGAASTGITGAALVAGDLVVNGVDVGAVAGDAATIATAINNATSGAVTATATNATTAAFNDVVGTAAAAATPTTLTFGNFTAGTFDGTAAVAEVFTATNDFYTGAQDFTNNTVSFDVTIDGGAVQTITLDDSYTSQSDILNKAGTGINDQLTGATATVAGGKLVITSDSTGATSDVVVSNFSANPVYDGGSDFLNITGNTTVAGVTATTSASTALDGAGALPNGGDFTNNTIDITVAYDIAGGGPTSGVISLDSNYANQAAILSDLTTQLNTLTGGDGAVTLDGEGQLVFSLTSAGAATTGDAIDITAVDFNPGVGVVDVAVGATTTPGADETPSTDGLFTVNFTTSSGTSQVYTQAATAAGTVNTTNLDAAIAAFVAGDANLSQSGSLATNNLIITGADGEDISIDIDNNSTGVATSFSGFALDGAGTYTEGNGTPAVAAANPTYTFSVNGVDLNLTTQGADGTITGAEVATAIGALDGFDAANTTYTGTTLTVTTTDGRNITLADSGSDSDGIEGLAGGAAGAGTTLATAYGTLELTTQDTNGITVTGQAGGLTKVGLTAVTNGTDNGVISGTTITNTDISTVSGANSAIASVDNALTTINSSRASLGAIQNRFESVVASLGASAENLSAARSRIRDADFAQETAALTRTQILQQAGVSILSQANALPQLVLSLLQ